MAAAFHSFLTGGSHDPLLDLGSSPHHHRGGGRHSDSALSEPTCDPGVVIEARRPGYIRYRQDDGRRWEVFGICAWTDPATHGPCSEGATTPPYGPSEGRLDVPVTPELVCTLCVDDGHLTFREL